MVYIPLKYLLLCVVGVASALLIWLAKEAFKSQVVEEFERGFAANYALVRNRLDEETEILSFSFRHLGFRQVCFLFICWIIRMTEPDTSLNELRFPMGAANSDVHTGNIGVGSFGTVALKPRVDVKSWRAEGIA